MFSLVSEVMGYDEDYSQVTVSLDLLWTAKTPPFHFDIDYNHSAVATAMATESWSPRIVQNIKE